MIDKLGLDLLERIANAANVDEVSSALQVVTESLEANGFFCVTQCSRPLVPRVAWALSSRSDWANDYMASSLHLSDPFLNTPPEADTCSLWQRSHFASSAGDYWALCEREGFDDGVVVTLHQSSIWKLVLGWSGPKALIFNDTSQAALRLAAVILLHTLVHKVMPNVVNAALPKMSSRELSCLGWAARGFTASEIGSKLEISEPTVVFHLNNMIRKLDVNNRSQAIAIGMAMGLIP